MDLALLEKKSDSLWEIPPTASMHVPARIYASEDLIRAMDAKVSEQLVHVASLPGIVGAAYAMPDAHWGYGFPIGGVAAFDAEAGGVISAGGVGFDISCGVRLLKTGLSKDDLLPHKEKLADLLFASIPAGVGSQSALRLSGAQMDAMLRGGAGWAIDQGYGLKEDLERIEDQGCVPGAVPEEVSAKARERQRPEMGTLGSGNHYLEVQEISEIYDAPTATLWGLAPGEIVVSIHCGSRGLGHQIGSEYLRLMVLEAEKYQIPLPDRELACAPVHSQIGQSYLGALRAASNCALANRQILTHFTRGAFRKLFPHRDLPLLFDVSHNTCKEEEHRVHGEMKKLFVHRKGATRAFGPGHPALPEMYRASGQPVIIGGSMATGSFVLVGTEEGEGLSWSSSCHGAGRAMSRTQSGQMWEGRSLMQELAARGILIRATSFQGVAEEAPGAYKDVTRVAEASDKAGLARKVVRLAPHICVKG